ncbi:MAG: hypothetical protein IPJ07_14590 [Acidobacteria bacterium]|nr:hypothetical protein [Acidobacteriota bacterium]
MRTGFSIVSSIILVVIEIDQFQVDGAMICADPAVAHRPHVDSVGGDRHCFSEYLRDTLDAEPKVAMLSFFDQGIGSAPDGGNKEPSRRSGRFARAPEARR